MDSIAQQPDRQSFFKVMLPLFVLAHCAHHLLTALTVPLLPFIRDEFALDYTRSSFVISAFTLAYGFGQLPAGWLADRFGARLMLMVGICGVAVAGVLVGLSQTYVMLLACLALMGLAGGGYHPSATPLISESVEPERRSRALGFHLIGGSISHFLTPLIASAIVLIWGWRGSFLSLAVPAALFGAIFYFILRRRAGTGLSRRGAAVTREIPPGPGYKGRLAAFMVMNIAVAGVVMSVLNLMPLYIRDYFQVPEAEAAMWLSIVFSAGLWVGPIGGYISERLGKIRLILVMTVFLAVCVLMLRMAPYGWWLGVVLFFFGIGMYLRMPVAEAWVMSQTTARNRSMIFGIFYFAMQEAGAVFAPVIGYLFDTVGFHTTFALGCAWVVVVTAVCSPFLWGKSE